MLLFLAGELPLTAVFKDCFLRRIISFLELLVYTNVWVGLAVVALCSLTFLMLGVYDATFLLFVFFSTLLMYAYARWFDSPARAEENTSRLTDWTSTNRLLFVISGVIGLVGTLWHFFQLNPNTWLWLAICGVISALYPLRFFKYRGQALRNISGLKLFLISLVWAIVTTVLPAAQINEPIDLEVALLTLQRFFFIMAITIPFDIRDLRVDSPDISTLPYKYGVKKARTIALIFLLIAEVGALILFLGNLFTVGQLVGQIIAFEITSLFIYRSTPNRHDLFFSFGVEGTSIILFLVVFIFNYFWP